MTREKMDFEKSVKRTSIKRNSQLKTICEDIPESQKSSRMQTHLSPLSSSLTSHPGIVGSTRSDDKPVSVDSTCRPKRDKTARETPKDKIQVADQTRSLSHENEVSTFILSTSPPPTATYESGRKLQKIGACTNQDNFLESARAKSKGNPSVRVSYTPTDCSDESCVNYDAVQQRGKLIRTAVTNSKTGSSAKVMQSAKYTSSSEAGYFRPQVEIPRETPTKRNTRISPVSSGHTRQCKAISDAVTVEGRNNIETVMSGAYVSSSLSSNMSVRNYSTARRRLQRSYKSRLANDASSKITTKTYKDSRGVSVPEISYLMPRDNLLGTPDKPLVQPTVSFPVAVAGDRMLSNITHINQHSPHLCFCNRQGPYTVATSSFDDDSKYDDTYSFGAPVRGTTFTQNHFQAKRMKHVAPRHNEQAVQIYRCTQQKAGQEDSHNTGSKTLVSKETQYSDLEIGRLQNIARKNGVRTSKIVQCTVDAAGKRKVSSATHRASSETRGTDRGTSPMKPGLPDCELISSGNSEFGLQGSRYERNADRVTSDSTNGGFKCDSLLQDILKTVTKKICGPAFQNDSSEKVGNQVTKKSSHQWYGSQPGSSRGEMDIKMSPVSNLMTVEKSTTLRSCDALQRVKSNSSIVDNLQNREPSPERSTLSLEVKSVNLSFCCANKHIKNSSRQIKIKWATCPDTNSRWRTEKIVVDSIPDYPKNVAQSLGHGISEKDKQQIKKLENSKSAAPSSVTKNASTGKNHPDTKRGLVSPEQSRRLPTKQSNTTLRSPSPSKTRNVPRKRKSSKTRTKNATKDNDLALIYNSTDAKPQGLADNDVPECPRKTLQVKSNSSVTKSHNASDNDVRYKYKRAATILARKTTDNMAPRTEDRSLLLHLDWGVFIIVVTTVPLLLFLLSLNFFLRASTTEEASENYGDKRGVNR